MSPGGPHPSLISRPHRLAPWLPVDVPALDRAIVEEALTRIGIAEEGGSNRGPQIDGYLRSLAVPIAQPWCAALITDVYKAAGAEVPPGWRGASTDEWMRWAIETKRWSHRPYYGAAVLYGVPGNPDHIGAIVRLTPHLYSVEGNTIVGISYGREGVAVDLKEVARRRVIGYCHPLPQGIP